MREIRLGLEKGLGVSIYSNKFIFSEDMQEVRKDLEKDLDVIDKVKYPTDLETYKIEKSYCITQPPLAEQDLTTLRKTSFF